MGAVHLGDLASSVTGSPRWRSSSARPWVLCIWVTSRARSRALLVWRAGRGERPASPAPPEVGSAEEVVQIAVHAVLDHGADGLEGALLGVARSAGVAEDVVGDAVDVGVVALDHRGVLVELGRALAQPVLRVAVLGDVGELLREDRKSVV